MTPFGATRGRGALALFAGAALAFLALSLPQRAAADSPAGIFHPETFTLSNGLQVVVVTNRRAPVVLHMMWYKAGAADEPPGKSGIAHFLEHLMFKGTKTLGPGMFSKIVSNNGGQENAFTSADYTAYYQSVARDRLETVMKIEADRMSNLSLAVNEVASERKVILEERRMRTENSPRSILWEQAYAALYLNHPYRIPTIGWEHEMKGLTREDAMAFYRRWYAPNNAVLVIAGDVTAADVRPLAEKYYGVIPRRDVPVRARPLEPPQRAARRVVYKDSRVDQPSWARIFIAPSYQRGLAEGDAKYAYALQVLSEIMGGGSTSRLYQEIVVKQRLAANVDASYSPSHLDYASFYIYGSPRTGVAVERLETAIEAEIAKLLEKGVTADEVARAKQVLMDRAAFARDNLRTGAMSFGVSYAIGRNAADVEAWADRIGQVTADEVNAAARLVLKDTGSVTAVLLGTAGKKLASRKPAASPDPMPGAPSGNPGMR
ncbi:MAG: insulinase family protein [Rhodospirillaceae bacterium]|nr:insulinase family protein [Rhodospirillaceae bacterium]